MAIDKKTSWYATIALVVVGVAAWLFWPTGSSDPASGVTVGAQDAESPVDVDPGPDSEDRTPPPEVEERETRMDRELRGILENAEYDPDPGGEGLLPEEIEFSEEQAAVQCKALPADRLDDSLWMRNEGSIYEPCRVWVYIGPYPYDAVVEKLEAGDVSDGLAFSDRLLVDAARSGTDMVLFVADRSHLLSESGSVVENERGALIVVGDGANADAARVSLERTE